jgi:hypothetical protein
MADDLHSQRLQEAIKNAVLDLLAHEHVGLAGFTFSLNDRLSVAVKQTRLIMDSDRFESMEKHGISVRPGFAGRDIEWIANFEHNGFTRVFAGATAREAIDLAIADATKTS